MNVNELIEKATVLYDEAKAIMTADEVSAEDAEKAGKMIEEANDLKGRIAQLQDIKMSAAELSAAMDENPAAALGAEGVADDGAVLGSEFKGWTPFLKAAHVAGQPPYFTDPRLRAFKETGEVSKHEQKQMVENVGASGGFLVPTEYLAQLQAVLAESAIGRPRATIIRMRRRQIDIPVLDQTGTTSGRPHWFGGMRAYWAEEAHEKTLTEAEFRKVSLVAHKLIMYTRASDELIDDSAISLADFLAGPMGFSGCIAWNEDYAFLQGTGAGQPLGIINAGATIVVARAAAGAIGFADVANMMENFLPGGRGVWMITQSAMSEIIQMNGPAGNPSYIWQPNARDGVPGYLLGMPVIWTEKLPLIGTQGDIVLADWRYYLIGDRQATTVESTRDEYFRYDQTSWRAVHRVDGQPWLSAPLRYQDGTTQVSPFVILGDVST